ncbi:MAG: 50S ribosomal protein L4 [Elusimicrobiota bacterium]
MDAPLLNMKGEVVGRVDLRENVFGLKPNPRFLHEMVTVYEANLRRWTANTKTKAQVSGSGKKPWKQKHTGRARAGSIRSPLWRHGGIVFGPHAGRGARLDFPARKLKAALAQALSGRLAEGLIVFLEKISLPEPKTKNVSQMLKNLGCHGEKSILVMDAADAAVARASRNIPLLEIVSAADINAYAVLRARRLIVTTASLEKLSSRWN